MGHGDRRRDLPQVPQNQHEQGLLPGLLLDQVEPLGPGGLDLEGGISADVWTAPRFALSSSIGFRHARINKVKAEGETIYKANGSRYELDYSGVFLRAGVKLR